MAELPQNPTDEEILAYYRDQYPGIAMTSARGLYFVRRRFRHLAVAAEQKRQEAVEKEHRRLRA